ncbi:cytochrome c biogenesis protein CcdA [Corynebacterium sp. NML130628]|uniref:cytochrome c biogenesis protein CcdA n=1 Tax=Corynebacterium sp. NML130628 TaxID=1906333 RepID=UPI0008FB9019|nr:cytochrome c biogenesis protein CcdA [Corynebacterium sp. NML130628]OIR46439.1 hypothetical protein BJP07_00345 [Corynebacterium sp. NML130628]
MFSVVLVGFIGGVITALSPCILPVLPVVLGVSVGRRPSHVVAGLTISFAVIALLGSLLLSALHLPPSVLRWTGITLLCLVGLGMIFPKIGEVVQKPFDAIPRPYQLQQNAKDKGSFVIGLALGAVYVPCAGPVLAAVTVAGSTGEIGWNTVLLTVAFALGSALPLFIFALAGNKIGEKVDVVQRHRRSIGVVVLVFTLALALNAPAAIQRSLPNWTAGLSQRFENSDFATNALGTGELNTCRRSDPTSLLDCGPAPEFAGLENWINTDRPPSPHDGGVMLVDFWAYACINCQRAGEHITKLYDAYRDVGLTVVGIHSPEYGFEHDLDNVKAAVEKEGIHYPVAQDNSFATWKNFNNRYWPARYLIDQHGNVRQIVEGEGSYAETEQLIRELLREANPDVVLPEVVEKQSNESGTKDRNPETYLGTTRAKYTTQQGYTDGSHDFGEQPAPERYMYTLSGKWTLGPESVETDGGHMDINVYAAWVQLVVSGKGEVEVEYPDGSHRTFNVSDGTLDLVKGDTPMEGVLQIRPSAGVKLYSLTFG